MKSTEKKDREEAGAQEDRQERETVREAGKNKAETGDVWWMCSVMWAGLTWQTADCIMASKPVSGGVQVTRYPAPADLFVEISGICNKCQKAVEVEGWMAEAAPLSFLLTHVH